MEIALLKDIVLIFALSVGILVVCHRFHVPVIVGFLLSGILAGPYGLGLIDAVHEIEILAEVGVVLLLFTIGMEFSFEKLLRIKKSVLLGGSLQVVLTTILTFLIVRQFGLPLGQSVFIGFLVSLSSTAIVLKLIQQSAEVDSPHGQTTLGILIYQDIIIVPMIFVTPILGGSANHTLEPVLFLFAKGIGVIVLVLVSAKWIVPQLLYQITRTRIPELFLLSVVVICLSIAWVSAMAGLSLGLGAFLAGLIISESEYSHQAISNMLPFRDVFASFFFVSIGMLLNVAFLFQHPVSIVLIALGVLVLKSVLASLAPLFLGFPLRTSILVGLALGQIGEFSFILSRTGVEHGLLAGDIYQAFLAVSILTMAATPFMIKLAPHAAEAIVRLPLPTRLLSGAIPVSDPTTKGKKDHLIIIGFGVVGRNVARAARSSGISYTIVEMNPETVRQERARGEPIHYGDATQELVLQHANISKARVVVIAINDPTSTRRMVEIVRRLNPKVHLIVRTRYLLEMKPLSQLGANEIIPEEFETSVEIFARVLAKYRIPRERIEALVAQIRSDGYELLRDQASMPQS